MLDLVGSPYCWFSHVQAQMEAEMIKIAFLCCTEPDNKNRNMLVNVYFLWSRLLNQEYHMLQL